jgi:hypothetical protein
MKKAIYLLLLLFTISSCSKDKDPKPSDNVKGNWALQTGEVNFSILGQVSEEDYDFKNTGIYINIKDDGTFESNLAVDYSAEEIFGKASVYQSTYKVEGNFITFQLSANGTTQKIPVKAKIAKATNNELQLTLTKTELLEALTVLANYIDIEDDLLLFSLVTSMDVILNFSK